MAKIYISYRALDRPIVDLLVPLLEEKGHTLRYDRELPIGADWRKYLMGAILSSDAVLLLWSENTITSQYIPAEVGMVRATPKLALMPVLIGNVTIPAFIQDLKIEHIENTDVVTLGRLAEKIDYSVRKHIEFRNMHKLGKPKIFISHRHKDEGIVRALLDCIEGYYKIEIQDIRCTSVYPYRLRVGDDTSDRLRDEITDAEIVLGILTTDTLESSYVAFELGSAWGQKVWTCPLLARGADQSHIPDPIRGISALYLTKQGDCLQLLKDMEGITSLTKQQDINEKDLNRKIYRLIQVSKPLKKPATMNKTRTGKKVTPSDES